jgi:hypothetical protein
LILLVVVHAGVFRRRISGVRKIHEDAEHLIEMANAIANATCWEEEVCGNVHLFVCLSSRLSPAGWKISVKQKSLSLEAFCF